MKFAPASDVRRILVITYHFPPDGAIGGQRWAGLSRYLARLGCEVHIITAAAQSQRDSIPGVTVHVRRRRQTLNDFYKSASTRLRGLSRKSPAVPAQNSHRLGTGVLPGPLAVARRLLNSAMDLPDAARGWIGPATGAARSLLRQRKFDVVITSGPPHSVHFVGMLATMRNGTPFWIDMRDPWALIHGMNARDDWFASTERVLLRLLERVVFPRASKIIVNTREFASALRLASPGLDVTWFPNGVDLEQLPTRDPKSIEGDSIAYVGTLYAGRNLSSVCAAMRQLLNDRPDAAATLRLNVAGPIESPHRRQLEGDIAFYGLDSLVHIHGDLPRAQALQLLSRSRLALVLAQNQPLCVPAKVYESVGLGVPTLVIAEEGSAASSEARRIGAMAVDGHDVEGIRRVFEDMLRGRIPSTVTAATPVSYHELATRMLDLFRDTLQHRETEGMREAVTSPMSTAQSSSLRNDP